MTPVRHDEFVRHRIGDSSPRRFIHPIHGKVFGGRIAETSRNRGQETA